MDSTLVLRASRQRAITDEAVGVCTDLIRINTGNDGEHPERPAAEYVARRLDEAGLDHQTFEPRPGRTSVVSRVPGRDRSSALLIHAHLDTVPVNVADWHVDPFGGQVKDGCVWGRGAVDMKNMVAMTLATVRGMLADGELPARDVVLAFVADEEAGGENGAGYLVGSHPELFDGCTDAIGEVGGFSVSTPGGKRIYPVQVAEKGVLWLELRHNRHDVDALCEGVLKVGRHRFSGQNVALGNDEALGRAPALRRLRDSGARHTVNPTILGDDDGDPIAVVDGRFLPGRGGEFRRELNEVLGPEFEIRTLRHSPSVENPADSGFFRQIRRAVRTIDDSAEVAPFLLSAGTDAKWFAQLGINCYGFSPLWLPDRFDFLGMFHGVDERVPVDALGFGCHVLRSLLVG
jgi:acetylornithine deacetylase/succinyl-diaminopimelate desuccinylase-like protein